MDTNIRSESGPKKTNSSGKALPKVHCSAAALGDQLAKSFALETIDLGIRSSGNPRVDDAVRSLRLIHVAQLRDLQTRINHVLSDIQKVTAKPVGELSMQKTGR